MRIDAGAANVARLLLAAGADVDARCADGTTALWNACRLNQLALVETLVEGGADVNARDRNNCSVLRIANARLLPLLVAAGAREWEHVPAPCPGLEAALPAVLHNTPADLRHLRERLGAGVLARLRAALMCLRLGTPLPAPLVAWVAVRACSE